MYSSLSLCVFLVFVFFFFTCLYLNTSLWKMTKFEHFQKHINSLIWPTLKTSREINSNEAHTKTRRIERSLPCVSLLCLSLLFIIFNIHLEGVKDGHFSHFSLKLKYFSHFIRTGKHTKEREFKPFNVALDELTQTHGSKTWHLASWQTSW